MRGEVVDIGSGREGGGRHTHNPPAPRDLSRVGERRGGGGAAEGLREGAVPDSRRVTLHYIVVLTMFYIVVFHIM